MKRREYITRTLAALCGTRPATPSQYHLVAAMADRAAGVYEFSNDRSATQGDACQSKNEG
jgi:hypothetical protein